MQPRLKNGSSGVIFLGSGLFGGLLFGRKLQSQEGHGRWHQGHHIELAGSAGTDPNAAAAAGPRQRNPTVLPLDGRHEDEGAGRNGGGQATTTEEAQDKGGPLSGIFHSHALRSGRPLRRPRAGAPGREARADNPGPGDSEVRQRKSRQARVTSGLGVQPGLGGDIKNPHIARSR